MTPQMLDRVDAAAAAIVLCVGVLALLSDHCRIASAPIPGFHALFGFASSVAVVMALAGRASLLSETDSPEFYLHLRLVSRCVYILMYVLAFVRIALNMMEMEQGTLCRHLPQAHATWNSLEDFQIYVGLCVVPLWTVRALLISFPLAKRPSGSASLSDPDRRLP